MGIKAYLTDPQNNQNAHIDINPDEQQALIVATRPLKTFDNQIKFFTNTTHGVDMNLGVLVGGNPEVVYKENTEWTTSAISGTWNFASNTVAPYAGVRCIEAINTVDTDTAQFAKGSSYNLTHSISITGYVYLTTWSTSGTKGVKLYGWNTTTGVMVGNEVDLGNYITTTTLDSWQKFTIPISAMGLTGNTISAIRVRTIDIGAGNPPDYYLDDIQIEESPYTTATETSDFIIEPDLGTWLYVQNFHIFMADDSYDSTLANNSMPKISYKTLLGVSALASGIVYRRVQDGNVQFSYIIRQLSDFLSLPGSEISASGSDGSTNSWMIVEIEFVAPLLLKAENNDQLVITINDDLSGLNKFRISAGCWEEIRT